MKKELFNQTAFEKMSSPEQLDRTLQVISPCSWIAVLGIAMLFCAVIVWSVIGRIPEKVGGSGIILSTGKVSSINSPASGMIKDVFVSNGSTVKSGQIVARLQRTDLLDQLQAALQALDDLQEEYRAMEVYVSGNLKLIGKKLSTSKVNLDVQRIHLKQEKIRCDENAEKAESLFRSGLITEIQFRTAQNEAENAANMLREIELRLADISVNKFQVNSETQQKMMDLEQRIDESCRMVETLQINYRNQTKIVSGINGNVFEVTVRKGDYVATGSSIAKLEPTTSTVKKYQAILYFDPAEGKKIKRGMNIAISPSIIKQEEYGYILGIVTDVSGFPVTPEYITNTIHHSGLVSKFSQSAPVEIKADLIPDPSSYSHYRWSSSRGPKMEIESGMMCSGEVTVREQRPISLVIPPIKKVVLGIGETVTVSGED